MRTYNFHPAAHHFPLHTPEEFTELLRSLRQHGYDASHPIVLCDDQILDGRNRYRACQELGLEATFTTFTGNPFEKAWLENGSRRDLQAGQKAAIRLKIDLASADWQAAQEQRQHEANQKRRAAAQTQPRAMLDNGRTGFSGVVSRDTTPENRRNEPLYDRTRTALGKDAGVSSATAARVQSVAKKAPHLLDEIAAGTLSLQDATRQANREVIKAKVGDLWTPFERERRRWVEELGYPTLANYHRDPHLLEWAKSTGRHVFIGRGSLWGNPFEVGKDGDRAYVLDSYCLHYFPRKLSLQKILPTLDGQVLECYCVPERCHGELLIETLNRVAWELLDAWLTQEGASRED